MWIINSPKDGWCHKLYLIYVRFLVIVSLQELELKIQQIPNPIAQLPSANPLSPSHSDWVIQNKIKCMGYIIGKVSLIVIHYWTYRAQTHSRKTVGGRAFFIRKCCYLKNAKMVNFVSACKGRSTCTLTKPVDSSPWNSAPIHLIGKNIIDMIKWSWGTSLVDYLAATRLSPPTERACDLQSYYSLHYN